MDGLSSLDPLFFSENPATSPVDENKKKKTQ
jgi:hypothetical protein